MDGPELAPDCPVVVRRYQFDGGYARHNHAPAQLIYSPDGVISVHLDTGTWVAPPQRAVWIPGGVAHRVSARRCCQVVALYADPSRVDVPTESRIVFLDLLARELLMEASNFEASYRPDTPEERLIRVILDRLPQIEMQPLVVPHPTDERLRRLCAMVEADPADRRNLDELASAAGMSGRTATRLFRQETHLTFAHWRQQVRLLAALELLGAGESVTWVAHAIGYRDVSAFIAMFRAAMGTSPARYFEGNHRGGNGQRWTAVSSSMRLAEL